MDQQRLTQVHGLYIIQDEERGRGVACLNDIPEGSTIELCPTIMLDTDDTKNIHKTHLHDYYFLWDIEKRTSAIALGYGSLYNHSTEANCDYQLNDETQEIHFFATKDIKAGEEILINYQTLQTGEDGLWFEER